MPSPVGHSLVGLGGFILMRRHVKPRQQLPLLLGAVFLANLADLDVLPGVVLGDPSSFHHQGMHSLLAVALCGLALALVAGRRKLSKVRWGIWASALYGCHVLMDLLVDDPGPPFGAQVLWPFSEKYFISPITPFASFEYFDPTRGMLNTMLSSHNLMTALKEILLLAPLIAVVIYFEKVLRRRTSGEMVCNSTPGSGRHPI